MGWNTRPSIAPSSSEKDYQLCISGTYLGIKIEHYSQTADSTAVETILPKIYNRVAAQSKMLSEHVEGKAIKKTPGVCGGEACIRNTRVPVWTLISLHQQGADNTELLRNYPSLVQSDLESAHAYYTQHSDEIDRAMTT